MTTISYDRPVADYISALSATGHVTHASYKKTSVTLHHNGGINTFDDVLNTWRTRQASAHFDVDGHGNVAQFVKVDEYAWAVGNTEGNEFSISIEMCDATLGPEWMVSDVTWKAAARLAAWLFAHVIGEAPSSANFFPHHYWSSTDCPGPYIGSLWNVILMEVQNQYNLLKGGSESGQGPASNPSSSALIVDGVLGPKTITRWQQILHTPVDGVISSPVSTLVSDVQVILNARVNAGLKVDGAGIAQDGKFYHTVQALQKYLGTPQDGVMSVPVSQVVKAVQTRLNQGRF